MQRQAAFSLIELVIAMAILGLLASMAAPLAETVIPKFRPGALHAHYGGRGARTLPIEAAEQPMAWTKPRSILDDTDSRAGRTVAFVIQALIASSIVLFCIETVPGLSDSTRRVLAYAEAARRGFVTGEVGRGTFVRRTAPEPVAFRFAPQAEAGLIDMSVNLPPAPPDPAALAQALATISARPGLGRMAATRAWSGSATSGPKKRSGRQG